jgi:hypothetical protein
VGVLSGIVTYANGQPSTMSYVSAAVGGLAGGVTQRVRTDSQGRFVLTWSANCGASAVYVDGREVDRNVPNGAQRHYQTR